MHILNKEVNWFFSGFVTTKWVFDSLCAFSGTAEME